MIIPGAVAGGTLLMPRNVCTRGSVRRASSVLTLTALSCGGGFGLTVIHSARLNGSGQTAPAGTKTTNCEA